MHARLINKFALFHLLLIVAVLPLGFGWFTPPSIQADAGWEAQAASSINLSVEIPLEDGVSNPITIRYDNSGTQSWYPSGIEPVVLSYRHRSGDNGGHESAPGIWESAFRCNDWPHQSNFWAATVQSTTVPGATGSFTFRLCNNRNKPVGTYREQFDIAHGGFWFYDAGWAQPVRLTINVVAVEPPTPTSAPTSAPTSPSTPTSPPPVATEEPTGQWLASVPMPASMTVQIPASGQSTVQTISVQNLGTKPWSKSGNDAVILSYRWEPGDSGANPNGQGQFTESSFACSNWMNTTGYHLSRMNEDSVPPGGTATFDVWMCNPHHDPVGTIKQEHVALAHGGEWMPTASDVSKVMLRIEIIADETYEAEWVAQDHAGDETGPFVLVTPDGESEGLAVWFKNTGTAPWQADNVLLKPQPRDAAGGTPNATFACAGTNAVAALVNGPVAPDETGEFHIPLCGNSQAAGFYVNAVDFGLWVVSRNEFMDNPTNGNSWGKANVWWNVEVTAPQTDGYAATWVTQSYSEQENDSFTADIPAGTRDTMQATFENTGTLPWTPGQVRLRLYEPPGFADAVAQDPNVKPLSTAHQCACGNRPPALPRLC